MSEGKVIIIDNKSNYVEQTRTLLLKLGFEPTHIWPQKNEVFTNWADVLVKLTDLKGKGF